jgi:hypothetical protein
MKRSRLRVRQVRPKHRRSPGFGKEIFIMLAIIIAAGTWRVVNHEFRHKKLSPAVNRSEWRRYSPGGSQLSLMLPGEPQLENVDAPTNLQDKVKQITRYKWSSGDLQIAVWDITYFDGVSTDIHQAAEGAGQALRQSEGVTEYRENRTPIGRSGRSGLLINGAFKRYDKEMELEAILLGDGPRLWQVIVTHPASDADMRAASRSVLDSVSLEHP